MNSRCVLTPAALCFHLVPRLQVQLYSNYEALCLQKSQHSVMSTDKLTKSIKAKLLHLSKYCGNKKYNW